jgi:hypothetical protein
VISADGCSVARWMNFFGLPAHVQLSTTDSLAAPVAPGFSTSAAPRRGVRQSAWENRRPLMGNAAVILRPPSARGSASTLRSAMRTDNNRRAVMLEQARELAAHGHYPLMIEAVLMANGFPEAAEWIHQPHIQKELKDIAERARKKAVGLSTEDRDDAFGLRH